LSTRHDAIPPAEGGATLDDLDAIDARGTILPLSAFIDGPNGLVEASPEEVLDYLRAAGAADVSFVEPA